MKLVIISHTEHYKNSDGTIVGWGSTVNEINHLAMHFSSITHVAMLHDLDAPHSSQPYTSDNIEFIALPPLGGKTIRAKFKLLLSLPTVISTVRKALKNADVFQLRTPTGIGVYLIPYLTFFSKKKGWFKYAGNWNQERPPYGYRLQRWFLKKQSRIVTINGSWTNQPKHCLTFENPCLTDSDIQEGQQVSDQKSLDTKLSFCYVGRVEKPKGVGRIIDAFSKLSSSQKERIDKVHIIGDGDEMPIFKEFSDSTGVDFIFHGYLNRKAVFDIYRRCHFFLMPTSASEGFPKVIAEAANFGCIPVVSSVSAITQYVEHNKNGLILTEISGNGLKKELDSIFKLNNETFKTMLGHHDFVKSFTFNHYSQRLLKEVLS